ncbi:MAG: TonB-dependent receptor family protein [Bacteroidales bacterium]|nr:TonB-dependent receptor family protein [Bacteroidales bacterium]
MMKFLRLSVLLATFLLSIQVLYAQDYRVQGTVCDTTNGQKIFYATVVLTTTDTSMRNVAVTYTESNGHFQLDDVPAGNYFLKVILYGYDTPTLSLAVNGSERNIQMGTIWLHKAATMLGEVSVTTEKPLFMMEGEKTLYNVDEDPMVQTGTAADALQNAPGVEVDIEGNITLRGVSSVEIWLNDKPSNLTEESLKEFIQQLPANSISRIEVITNPSAKYGTNSDGGIINIVTTSAIKKNEFFSFGVNGSSRPNVSPWFSYVWANKKLSLNLYLNTGYSGTRNNKTSYLTRFNDDMDTASVETDTSFSRTRRLNGNLFFHGTYTIDSSNSLGFWIGSNPNMRWNYSKLHDIRLEMIPVEELFDYNSLSDSRSYSLGGNGGMWFEHKFKQEGHKITANVGFSLNTNGSNGSYNRDYLMQDYMDRVRLDTNRGFSYNINGSIDYSIPYHKNGEISAGVSANYSKNGSTNSQDTLVYLSDNLFVLDSIRFIDSRTQRLRSGQYVTIQHKFGGFTIKAGLRSEINAQKYDILNSPTDNVQKTYWSLYPSLHLSYRTKSMHNLKLSYTRRVSQPSASQLSTYINYGEDSYSTGNPALLVSPTNVVEAGWTKFFRKFGSVGVTAYFRNSNNKVSTLNDVTYSDFYGRIVTFSMPVNAGKSINTGAEVNVTYRLKAFMSIRFYGNVYYDHSLYQFRDESDPREFSNLGYSFRINYWAKLWKVLEVFASANYKSKNITLFSTTKPRYSIDAGLRASFLDRKISIHLNVNDIFNWNKTTSENNNPYLISTSTNKRNSRFISAGITFRFGKMELESKGKSGDGDSEKDDLE